MAGVGLTGTLRGLNDEDKTQRQEDIRMFLPFWSENSDVLYLSIDPGKVEYIDFNASDPFGNTGRIINAFMNEEDMDKALINALAESIGPFAEPEMVANTVNNLYNGKKNSGAPLYPEGATDSQKADAIIKEFYDLYKPGLFSSIKTMRQSESKVRDGLLMMVGMRPYTVDIEKTFRYKTYDLAKKIRSAEKNENIDLYNESIKEMSDLYMAAIRLGVPSEDLVKDMRAISKDNKYKIRTGKF
jgi:mRNA-degrading endonuclease RelE of RelBE toxin-antitoxin system